MIKSLEIIKEKTHEECSKLLLKLISNHINEFEKFSIGLSGGTTPELFYKLFAKKYHEYSNITFWTVDERHVDTTEKISNQKIIKHHFSTVRCDIIDNDNYSHSQIIENHSQNKRGR